MMRLCYILSILYSFEKRELCAIMISDMVYNIIPKAQTGWMFKLILILGTRVYLKKRGKQTINN